MKKYIINKNEREQIVIRKPGEYVVELVGEGANAEIIGAIEVKNKEKIKIGLKVIHKAINTKADTIIKAVVDGNGEIDIRGKIIVEKKAQQTESFLQERVLLVSKKAKALAIPDLEIQANEVKCSHAATVGTLDKEQLYYLMSRGMSRKKSVRDDNKGVFTASLG